MDDGTTPTECRLTSLSQTSGGPTPGGEMFSVPGSRTRRLFLQGTSQVPGLPARRPPPSLLPLQTPPPPAPASTSLFACLVGELRDAAPQWQHIIDGIQALCPNLTSLDCHRLTAGDIFICGLSKATWRQIPGQTQQFNGGGSIYWRQPQPTNGAFPAQTTTRRMEARGVPFGLRTRRY